MKLSSQSQRALSLFFVATASLNFLAVSWSQTPNWSSSGILVFQSNRDAVPRGDVDENTEIYAIDPATKRMQRWTDNLGDDALPKISANGKRVAFVSRRTGNGDIYCFDLSLENCALQKGNPRRITHSTAFDTTPFLDSDGQWLGFVSDRASVLNDDSHAYGIYLVEAQETQTRPVVALSGLQRPTFTPDGAQVAFVYSKRETTQKEGLVSSRVTSEIYTVGKDGGNPKSWGFDVGTGPAISPDGDRIVFVRKTPRSGISQLYIADKDGRNLRLLSLPGATDDHPCFSPDGKRIAFDANSSSRSARQIFASEILGVKIGRDIYTMNLDGSDVVRMTDGIFDNINPSWGATPGVRYVAAPAVAPTPDPQIQAATQTLQNEPLQTRSEAFASGELIYAFNDLQTAPYPSFVGAQANGKTQTFRLDGPNLQGTDGDFVFDAQLMLNSQNVLLKLGDPAVRPDNPYNSYHLWNWNRQTNALTPATPRELFFRQVAPSPDGARLAYIAGGNALGQTPEENRGIGEPLRLYVYDPQSKTETLVSDNSGVRGGFAWLDTGTLLYTAVPAPEKSANNPRGFARPNIYAFDVAAGKSTLLLREARHPMPSPDGTRIAFWGLREQEGEPALPLPDNWWQVTGYAYLSAAKRDGSERKSMTRMPGFYPSIVWAPDNARLLIVGRANDYRGRIDQWNVATSGARLVAKLDARDAHEVERAWFQPQFRALSVAPDSKTLFVSVEEVGANNIIMARVQAIDLQSGKATLVAQLQDVAGFDWRSPQN